MLLPQKILRPILRPNIRSIAVLGLFLFIVTGVRFVTIPHEFVKVSDFSSTAPLDANHNLKTSDYATFNLTSNSQLDFLSLYDATLHEQIKFDATNDEFLRDRLRKVDEAQVMVLDYLEAVSSARHTAKSTRYLKSNFSLAHSYATLLDDAEYDRADFTELVRRGRAAYIAFLLKQNSKELYSSVSNVRFKTFKHQLNKILAQQTASLFPFLPPAFESVPQMQNFFSSQDPSSFGIAITCGTPQFYITYHLILSLRQVFGIDAPVEVFYAGDTDLRPEMVEAFNNLTNVRTVDLQQVVPQNPAEYSSWTHKPFAIIAASFRTVMYIDGDVLFFTNPLHVLESELFKKTGQLYYHDRSFYDGRIIDGPEWFKSLLTSPSPSASSLRYLNGGTSHEMDSGFMLLDKGRPGILFSLLLACRMNMRTERDNTLYLKTYGDKESFWFAHEFLRVPFSFSPYYGGTFGNINNDEARPDEGRSAVCGIWLLQMNETGAPFMWNGGGILTDRRATPKSGFQFLDFESLALGSNGKGDVPSGEYFGWFCFRQDSSLIWRLTKEQKDLLERYLLIYRNDVTALGYLE
ncbi:mannosyltransferase putative-domain-containing protein [Obelidium mucronatum]|nr:mannosyltransferase putative-domain-containing protein [Obelidium mucronatum]